MAEQPDTSPAGCPDDMACFDAKGMGLLTGWIGATLRWMEQVELACSGEQND